METRQNYGPGADQSTTLGQTAEKAPTTLAIKISTDAQGESVVSARELHEFLEVKSKFADWFKSRVERCGILEGQDFTAVGGFSKNLEKGGRPEIDYALTLDCAKELAMVQNNEQGKAARQYFIDCEKQLRQIITAPTLPSPTEQLLLRLAQQQTELAQQNAGMMQYQQLQIDQLRTDQQNQIDQLRADMAIIQSGKRPRRYKPVPPLPGVRPLFPEPSRDRQLRSEIHRIVNEYCERITSATQAETYKYLYDRMQPVYGVNVYRLGRWGNESTMDAIERYGYLDQLYRLAMGNLANAR